MIRVDSLTFNPFQENTYVLSDETGECIIIDPGCYDRSEKEELAAFIRSNGLKPVKLINTHAHLDHMLGNNFTAGHFGLQLEMHADDVKLLLSAPVYGQMWGIAPEPSPEPAVLLKEGDRILFGNSSLLVIHTPGHCPGSISLYSKDDRILIAGDVLFYGSIGRTDLPGGDHAQLINSIRSKLLPLGDEVTVYPGHGPKTTIGQERRHNPFLQSDSDF